MASQKMTESQFLWSIIKSVILLPLSLLQVLFRKKKAGSLLMPFKRLHEFFWQEPMTATLIIAITMTSLAAWLFLAESSFLSLCSRPSDLFSLRLHTLITAGFIHASIGHLLGNMLALLVFGRVAERALGGKKLLISYFAALIISGVASSLGNHFLLGNDTPGLGASGAIMGIVALAMLFRPLQLTYLFVLPLPLAAVGWIYIALDVIGLLGPEDGIGHLAHLGGFLSVALIAYLLGKEERARLGRGLVISLVTLAAMGALALFFTPVIR